LKVRPLNAEEDKWLKQAKKLFRSKPERFEFLTTGGPELVVIDKNYADTSELADGAAERDGIVLGVINTNGGRVHGVSG
jgi:hypothetical protein